MPRPRAAFTLIELLLVIAILGILAAAVAPSVGVMISGGRLSASARELAGAGRYARTMALLNQTPVDLVVDLGAGTVAVRARDREEQVRLGMSDLAALTNDVGYTEELLRTSARRAASLTGGFGLAVSHADADAGAATNLLDRWAAEGDADGAAPAPASQVSLSESIDVDRKLEGVAVEFAGWTDTPRSRRRTVWDADTAPASSGEIVVRYRANGTVRPHRWVVFEKEDGDGGAPGTGARIEIAVNAVGRPSVRLEGDSRR